MVVTIIEDPLQFFFFELHNRSPCFFFLSGMQGDATKVEVSGDVDDEGKTKDNNLIVILSSKCEVCFMGFTCQRYQIFEFIANQ